MLVDFSPPRCWEGISFHRWHGACFTRSHERVSIVIRLRKMGAVPKRSTLPEDQRRYTVRSLFLSSVLGIAVLGVTATLPSQASARHGGWRGGRVGWRRGWWAGRSWYPGRVNYYPYGAFYYPNYGAYYPPYAYYPPADYSAGSSFHSVPDSGLSGVGSAQAELPHPTGGAAVPPPDAGLIRLQVPDEFAKVSFNGETTSSVGTTREYVTPPLQAGKTYRYEITVSWGQGDQQATKQRTVEIARGQTRAVDFSPVPNGSAK
jgi:uncharacterized protein (TIGR03000 family)